MDNIVGSVFVEWITVVMGWLHLWQWDGKALSWSGVFSHGLAITGYRVAMFSCGVVILGPGVVMFSHGVVILSRAVTMYSHRVFSSVQFIYFTNL